MEKLERPRRADARRNRARIIASARKLFARLGNDAQMEEIAADCGLGMGTLYRHFPNKQALLTEIVRERFEGMIELAQAAERIGDPGEAFEAVLRSYPEAGGGARPSSSGKGWCSRRPSSPRSSRGSSNVPWPPARCAKISATPISR